MTFTLADAKHLIDASVEAAQARSAKISICVCDANGRLIALNRMDGALATSNHEAIGKALASASTGAASDHMPGSDDLRSPVGTVTGEGMPLIRRKGGVAVYRAGALVGACGVSGADTNEDDEACASAGIAAVHGLQATK